MCGPELEYTWRFVVLVRAFVRVYVHVYNYRTSDHGNLWRGQAFTLYCAFLTVSTWLVLFSSLMYISTVMPNASVVSITPKTL